MPQISKPIKKIRILQVGAHEELMMNYYRHLDSNICFDYVIQKGMADFKYKSDPDFNGKIWYVYSIKKNPLKWMLDLIKILNNEKYEIVHFHLGFLNFYGLIACLFSPGVKIKICHSHSFYNPRTNTRKFYRKISKYFINLLSTHRISCSIEAGNQMFNKDYTVLKNAINYDRLAFNIDKRNTLRKKLYLVDDNFVIGHVGNFSIEKNHIFIIEVFEILIKKHSNFKLLFIGSDFGTMNEILNISKQKSIIDNIFFLGQRNDVAEILQAMDCFIFPSIFEGLPLSLLEAQVSGLKCFYSSSISSEGIISNSAISLDLDHGPSTWAKYIHEYYSTSNLREDKFNTISTDFDVKYNKHILENFYNNLL
jgi:glycosyltransferase involved in cell wall biosynthesis